MEKQKRWQFWLIVAVIALTLYNILPTIFYYTKPLGSPVDAKRAEQIATDAVQRVNGLETDSIEWLHSFAKLLGVKPTEIRAHPNDPSLISVTFADTKQASLFKRFLPRAGAMIPFVPAQLELYPEVEPQPNRVLVNRQMDIRLNPAHLNELFQFSYKNDENGKITPFYRELTYDRLSQLALAFGGPSRLATQMKVATEGAGTQQNELVLVIAKNLLDTENALGGSPAILKRYYTNATQSTQASQDLIQKYLARAEALKGDLGSQRQALLQEEETAKQSDKLIDLDQEKKIEMLAQQIQILDSATALIQKNLSQFKGTVAALNETTIKQAIATSTQQMDPRDKIQKISLEGRNPFIEALVIDWSNDKITLQFYPDVEEIRQGESATEIAAFSKDRLNQLIINDIARASSLTDESITPDDSSYAIKLDALTDTRSLLALNLGKLAAAQAQQTAEQLRTDWNPKQTDLARDVYPILSYDTYKALKPEEQKLGLVIYAPSSYAEAPIEGFRSGSIYIIARGLDAIMQKYQQAPNSPEAQTFLKEIQQLQAILQQKGFIGYPGSTFGIDPAFRKDYIFELDDFYVNLLKASRENFSVKGSKRYAVLDFTNVEQRILAQNKIEDQTQEELLKWKEEYASAQVDLDATTKYLIPAPTKNAFWQNLKISFAKYFRGDDRKILKWGLDLSGGKTVRIGLRDHNNRPVTNPDDLRQAVNELYTRVNAMGVSERTIHIEGQNIILDFPGSQNISAAELIQASAMSFHIVNEKFTPANTELRDSIQKFLQEVWNEAIVTNRKDIESINLIAWQHLGGDSLEPAESRPISDAARQLYANGLRLANPTTALKSHEFNDTLSAIGRLRGEDFSEWQGQPTPLIVIFHNYALEGASLTNIQVGYDPSQGNTLNFSIKGSYEGAQGGNPRDDFYAWTSQFAEDRIAGTPKEAYAPGRGWRMAVILNGQIVSSPTLRAALRDGATISGHFSQREVNRLASDLKAGSLTFTPQILSEENVSPELGKEERAQGILASIVGLALVVFGMIAYYRFAGVVASVAVTLNILIMWGVLQNLGAALTLPSIAGIVLTIGMAVDANVLVFERIREEFKNSGRIASAIQAGYRKAFSAIVDSNITTIIAALILVQFDSGPIKGFAVSLIVGILSSMFTSLFLTRYFFAGWVQNPQNKALNMSQFIGSTHFNFLAHARKVITISLIIMAIGTYFFVEQRRTMFGMDFTGGYSLTVELVEQPDVASYRLAVADALQAHGATSNDIQVRELSKPTQLRIQLGTGMEQKGHPFYQMPETVAHVEGMKYEYQQNPRIEWVIDALAKANLQVVPSQLPDLNNRWTVISGQLSDTMRNNAIIALALALVSILIYITFRFEFKYAISAVIGLVHDVIITLGILALFHKLGFSVQIDLQVIGAIMTIIGYSLNDTIIVFDRIREDLHIMRKMSFPDIINHALNVTLSRTLMTSGTTLLVLIALVLLGGKSIFAFSLVMTIGVLVGTASSLFIATPALLYFHNREERAERARA